MPNKVKFAALAAAILLAGALAAGTAASLVVAPRTGRVWSAGEVSIPSVFGQTAEEVLFYPWSLYDTQVLYPLPMDDLLAMMGIEYIPYDGTMEYVWESFPVTTYEGRLLLDSASAAAAPDADIEVGEADAGGGTEVNTVTVQIRPSSYGVTFPVSDGIFGRLVGNFTLLRPLRLDAQALLDALEWNIPPDGSEAPVQAVQIYLKDFPAQVYPHGTDQPASEAVLRFAVSDRDGGSSVSFLICPKEARELTEEEQDRAMAAVDAELRQFFLSANITDTELGVLLQSFLTFNDTYIWGSTGLRSMTLRPVILSNLFADGYGRSTDADGRWYEAVDWPEELLDEDLPLDDFLSGIEAMGSLTVQLVTTQSQIVVLLTLDTGEVLGAYYDIQLGCWSGMGYMD